MTLPRRSRALTAVVGLTALVMLGACAGSTTGTGGTKEQSSILRAPAKPAALDRSDRGGARAAADYVLALYGYTYRPSNPDPLEAFCADDNYACRALSLDVVCTTSSG